MDDILYSTSMPISEALHYTCTTKILIVHFMPLPGQVKLQASISLSVETTQLIIFLVNYFPV
jgi:signal recognition particle receptor subunit beta